MVIDKVLNPIGVVIELLSPRYILDLLKVNNIILGAEGLFEVIAGRVIKVGDKVADIKEGDIVLIYPTGSVRWNENNKTYMYLTYNEILTKIEDKQ